MGVETARDSLLYAERLVSARTTALFAALAGIFGLLFAGRALQGRWDAGCVLFLVFSLAFLFYVFNYRVLLIRLTPEVLSLTFGVFIWSMRMEDIAACRPDDSLPVILKYGGAGIHFMSVGGRYRASFNFLEYPRLAVALRRRRGPVCEVSFSTRRPQELRRLIQERLDDLSQGAQAASQSTHSGSALSGMRP